MKWRFFYGILCALTLVAYVLPWARIGDKAYTGLQFTLPFSFPYLVGLMLAFVVLFTTYRPVGLTITAGILLLVGVFGGIIGVAIVSAVARLADKSSYEIRSGLVLAFLMSILYTIIGSIAGNKMKETGVVVEIK